MKVVPKEQKDLEAVGKKGCLKLGTLTDRDRYGYYYYLQILFLLILLLPVLIIHTETGGSMLTLRSI